MKAKHNKNCYEKMKDIGFQKKVFESVDVQVYDGRSCFCKKKKKKKTDERFLEKGELIQCGLTKPETVNELYFREKCNKMKCKVLPI